MAEAQAGFNALFEEAEHLPGNSNRANDLRTTQTQPEAHSLNGRRLSATDRPK